MIKKILKIIAIFIAVIIVLLFIIDRWSLTLSDEESAVYDEKIDEYFDDLEDYLITTPGNNFLMNYAFDIHKLIIQFNHIIGNQERELKYCYFFITYCEGNKYSYQMGGADETELSKWFEDKIPIYKNAVVLNLNEKIGNIPTAFFFAELFRGRTLTDHYSDVLISKNYAMFDDEKEKLQNYRIELEKLAKSGDEEEYLKLKREERKYKRYLRKKYSNLIIPPDWVNKEEYRFTLKDDVNKKILLDLMDSNFNPRQTVMGIPNNACLVEFLKISDDSIVIFVVHNDNSIKAVNIPTDKKFYDNVLLYHDLNAYPDINALHRDGKYFWSMADGTYKITVGRNSPNSSATAVNDNAKWLELRQTLSVEISQKILQPVEQLIGSTAHWIISPDAELNLIPFETLTYHDKMLVESVNVSYVPSLAVLNMMQHRERKNFYLGIDKDLFAMGNAVYGDNTEETSRGSQADFFNSLRGNNDDFVDIKSLRWNNLPGTDKEVDKVAALFESKDIFKQNDASEKNLKEMNEKGELAQYKYLLFSTHGLFVPEKPEWSSIVLSQEVNDEDNDGYVTITEWMGYDLRSSLVYLSACETGLGDYQVGEGIMGIPYALTVAGNKDTVMSLWKVDDEATAEFTAAVFEKLQRGKSEVAALNDTKREFLKKNNSKYSSPSVWSAFVLYGI